ncbi:helix-turn-helix domain-containing protein [Streptomyces anulatus]
MRSTRCSPRSPPARASEAQVHRDLRERAGLSKAQVARTLGVSPSTVTGGRRAGTRPGSSGRSTPTSWTARSRNSYHPPHRPQTKPPRLSPHWTRAQRPRHPAPPQTTTRTTSQLWPGPSRVFCAGNLLVTRPPDCPSTSTPPSAPQQPPYPSSPPSHRQAARRNQYRLRLPPIAQTRRRTSASSRACPASKCLLRSTLSSQVTPSCTTAVMPSPCRVARATRPPRSGSYWRRCSTSSWKRASVTYLPQRKSWS